jgi:predicted  nucleic acid-binding Zn-ribbon protein
MSFLKSILWKKSEAAKVDQLTQDIELAQKKIEDLESEIIALKTSVKEMTGCIQNITLVMHSLSQELLTIVMEIKGITYATEVDDLSTEWGIDDDDELLN